MRRKATPPDVDAERCTGCGLCVKACPSFVLEMRESKARVVNAPWCIGCGHCGAICPVEAVVQAANAAVPAPKPAPRPATSAEDLQLLLRERRSVRLYRSEPVPRAMLEQILEAGRYAPTGTNSQNVHYAVLTSPREIAELRGMAEAFYEGLFKRVRSRVGALVISLVGGRRMLEYLRTLVPMVQYVKGLDTGDADPVLRHARAVIVVHAETWDPSSSFNCAVALYNCSLMAHTLGVGCCFNGFVEGAVNHDRKIKKWLDIPRDHRCFGAMTLGFAAVKYQRLVERDEPKVQWR